MQYVREITDEVLRVVYNIPIPEDYEEDIKDAGLIHQLKKSFSNKKTAYEILRISAYALDKETLNRYTLLGYNVNDYYKTINNEEVQIVTLDSEVERIINIASKDSEIELVGDCDNILYYPCKIIDLSEIKFKPTSCEGMFETLISSGILNNILEYIIWGETDTSECTNMSWMFSNCYNMRELDLSNFDTSQVETMERMFSFCERLKSLDLSNFNTSKVKDMQGMFYACGSLTKIDLSNFDTSNVEDMKSMFYTCLSLKKLDLSNFNTSKVKVMSWMFNSCCNLNELNLSSFDTSKVKNMSWMFYNCNSLKELDLSSFDTSQVTIMEKMFSECNSLKELDLSSFNTSKVKAMFYMFEGCNELSLSTLKFPENDDKLRKELDRGKG